MANNLLNSWGSWAKSSVGDTQGEPSPSDGTAAEASATVNNFLNVGKSWLATSTQQLQTQLQSLAEKKPSNGGEEGGGEETNSNSTDEVKEKALQLGKGLLAGVSTFATTIKTTVENAKDEWEREQQKFTQQKKKTPAEDAGVAPWVGFADEEQIKSQILALSCDQRNFLVDPPPGAQFLFDYDTYASTAIAAMAADPELERLRYGLVPKKVSEVSFWRNYFYRVSLIKQQSTIKSMSRENTQTSLQDTKPSRPETASLSAPVTEHHDLLDSTPPKPRKIRDAEPVAEDHFVSQSAEAPLSIPATSNGAAESTAQAPDEVKPASPPASAGATADLDDIEKELNELDLDLEGVSDTHWSGDEDLDDLLGSD